MSRKNRTPDINDSDLQQVFRRQNRQEVSKDQDHRILQAAAESMGQDQEIERPPRKSRLWYKSLGAAALVVLSISIVPLLNQYTPTEMTELGEPALLDKSGINPATNNASSMEAVEFTIPPGSEVGGKKEFSVAPEPESAVPAREAAAVKQSISPILSKSPERRTLASESADMEEAKASAARDNSPLDAYAYRQYPESWLSYIHMLEKHNRQDEAAVERELFEKKFPDFNLQ